MQNRLLAFTNYDKIWEDTYLKQIRWRRDILLNNHWKDLANVSDRWNRLISKMSKEEQDNAIKDIRNTLSEYRKLNKWKQKTDTPMWLTPDKEYKQIINDFASIFYKEWWNTMNVMSLIKDVNSIDDIIAKLATNDLVSTMWLNNEAVSPIKAKELIYNWIRPSLSVKNNKTIENGAYW